jgi:hypothetical protein
LWVVCRRCARWNLTPLEERWEAIEEAERLFRGTRLRVSTDNIGLAKLSEGLELVRVGKPQRPEIAAWRYGRQFARRRVKGYAVAGVIAVSGGALLIGGVTMGLGAFAASGLGKWLWQFTEYGLPWQTVARIKRPHWPVIEVQRRHLHTSRITVGADDSLGLQLDHTGGSIDLEGDEARRAATRLLPAVTRFGGTPDEVKTAVERLDRAGDAERYLAEAARIGARLTRTRAESEDDLDTGLLALPTPLTLALEMALHEEQERRALEGELAELEAAWREAEEIGAIADSLFLPDWIERTIQRMKGEGGKVRK